MRKYISAFLCASMLCTTVSMQAITPGGMARVGIISTALSWAAMYYNKYKGHSPFPNPLVQDQAGNLKHKKKIVKHAIPAVGVGCFATWLSSFFTPEYRYKWAHKKYNEVRAKRLFGIDVHAQNLNDVIVASGAVSTGMPLVTLHLDLKGMEDKLSQIIKELEYALDDAGKLPELTRDITCMLDALHADRLRIRKSLHAVQTTNPQAWSDQWNLHEQKVMKQKEINAMHAMAATPQLHYGVNYHFRS